MGLGSLTSLGVGSGFELQSMPDQFREIDQESVNLKKTDIEKAEKQLSEFNLINAKILTIKSHALNLSLESNFLERTATSSKDEILTVNALPGATITNHTVNIDKLAEKSSWESTRFSSKEDIVYSPLVEEILTGHSNTDTETVVSSDQPLSITYDTDSGAQTFVVDITTSMTLDDVVSEINNHSGNQNPAGGTYVVAETYQGSDGKYGMRLTYPAPEKALTFQVGANGSPIDISVSANSTLAEIADQINQEAANLGITASVIDTGEGTSPYKLIIQANESGEDHRIIVTSQLTSLGLTELKGANSESLNAHLTVDGIDYQRQSNVNITDIINGLSLNLESEGTSSIDVSADTELIKSEISGIVDAFNDLIMEIKVNSGTDEESDEPGLLSNSLSIKSIITEISSLFASVVNTGNSISSIFDIGIDIDLRTDIEKDDEGNNLFRGVTLDEEALNQAILNNIEALTSLFIGNSDSGIEGLGDIINNALRDMTSSSGAVQSETNRVQSKIDEMETSIEQETERINKRYDLMAKEFVRLDQYIGKLNAQGDYLKSMFESFDSSSKNG